MNEARSILILLGFHDWPKQKEIDAYLEEMKGLRKVVEAVRKHKATQGCSADCKNLLCMALEAYESRGKV